MTNMDDFLNKQITIKEGIQAGLISSRVLSDCDIYFRVISMMADEKLPKTHAIEKLAETCRISERQVWYSYSATAKLIAVR